MSIYDLEMSAKTCGFANEHCDGYNWMRVVPDFLFFFVLLDPLRVFLLSYLF